VRVLWTLVKVVVALALVIPLGIVALAMALGIFGALLGLAIVVLRIAIAGLIAYGAFRLIAALVRGTPAPAAPRQIADMPRVDPYYEAAVRELDRDIGPIR
jgi:hypothetical protein